MKRAFSRKNLWDKTPRHIKLAIGSLLSNVPLPWLMGADFRRWYRFACEADRWDAEQAREYQLAQLRRIVTMAYVKTEFYRESFGKVGFEPGDLKQPEDLQGLPTIDKTAVRQHWQRMLTRPITAPDVDLVTTGGTSGETLRFYMSSSRHAPEFAHLSMCWKRVGFQLGDVMAVFRGRVITKPTNGMYYEFDPLLRHHYYSTFHMSSEAIAAYVDHINAVRPKFLHGYPSALFAVARHCATNGKRLSDSLRAALLESEPVFPHQRQAIRDYLGLPVFSSYGLSEKVVLAAECEHSAVYHVVPSYGYCELLDPTGRAVRPGELGEITGTGFLDTVMPLIRYRTEDYAVHLGTGCSMCGRSQMLLADVLPRRGQEMLVCRDGRTLISVTTIPVTRSLSEEASLGVLRFQFVQNEPGRAVLQLFVERKDVGAGLQRLSRHLQKLVGHCLDLKITLADVIPLTRTGKQPLVIQRWPGIKDLLCANGSRSEQNLTRVTGGQDA